MSQFVLVISLGWILKSFCSSKWMAAQNSMRNAWMGVLYVCIQFSCSKSHSFSEWNTFKSNVRDRGFGMLLWPFISFLLWCQNDQHAENNEHWDAQFHVDGRWDVYKYLPCKAQQSMRKWGQKYFKSQMWLMTSRKLFLPRHNMVEAHVQRLWQPAQDTQKPKPEKLPTRRTGSDHKASTPAERYWHLIASGSRRVNFL